MHDPFDRVGYNCVRVLHAMRRLAQQHPAVDALIARPFSHEGNEVVERFDDICAAIGSLLDDLGTLAEIEARRGGMQS
jgi:hypothetical protein